MQKERLKILRKQIGFMRLYKKKLFAGLVLAAMFVSSAYSAGNLQPEEAARSEHTAETTMETSEIATLEDNTAVDSFVRMMQTAPVVIQMNDYSGFEKVGSIGTSLPASNSQTTTQSGDIVLYNGNQIVIFYGSNSWSYTRLGKIDDLSGWTEALGSGDVTVTFSLE